jgi:excisionase family DNA binding protein
MRNGRLATPIIFIGVAIMCDGTEPDRAFQDLADSALLTVDEVAHILRVPRSWVYSHLDKLPTIRLGRYVRFRRSDIDDFLRQRGTCQ